MHILLIRLRPPILDGVPDDQIRPEVTRIIHTIYTQTKPGPRRIRSYFWWARQFHKYDVEHAGEVSNNS